MSKANRSKDPLLLASLDAWRGTGSVRHSSCEVSYTAAAWRAWPEAAGSPGPAAVANCVTAHGYARPLHVTGR